MDIREELRNWFDGHKPQANNIIFKRIRNDEDKWLDILEETQFLPESCKDERRLWHYYNKIYQIPKCIICGNELPFRVFSTSYPLTCSRSCTSKKKWEDGKMDSCLEQRVETFKTIWGKDGILHDELMERRKQTALKNYGVDHHMKSKEYYEKYRQNLIDTTGYDNVAKRPEVIQKIKDTWAKEDKDEVKDRINQNRVESLKNKYGVESAFSLPETQQKSEKTMLEKYGFKKPLQVDEFKQKQVQTTLEKYGYENAAQSPKIKEKKRQTMEDSKAWVPMELLDDWIVYKRAVSSVTHKSLKDFGDEKFGFGWKDTLGLMGVDDGMQVDHIYSIKNGFDNYIPAYIIGNINNLRIISWEENISKSSNSEISLEDLISVILF